MRTFPIMASLTLAAGLLMFSDSLNDRQNTLDFHMLTYWLGARSGAFATDIDYVYT